MKPKLKYYKFKYDKFIIVNPRRKRNSYSISLKNYIYQGIYSKKEKYFSRIINGSLFGIHLS